MDKTEYERATENDREAVKGMLRERDRRLVRSVLRQLEEVGALVEVDEREEITEGAVEEICERFWENEET
jgi:hypothetical protein